MKAIPAKEALCALQWLPIVSPNRQRLFSAAMQREIKPDATLEWLANDPLLLSALMDADNPCESAGGAIAAAGVGKLRRIAMGI